MLSVLLPELDGFFQRGFGKQLRAVEVVQSVLCVEPTADKAIVAERMADNLVELVARVAVLGFCIADGTPLAWFRHSVNVECESVRVGLTESPNLIGYGGDYAVLFRRCVTLGTCRQSRRTAQGQYYGQYPKCSSYLLFHFFYV